MSETTAGSQQGTTPLIGSSPASDYLGGDPIEAEETTPEADGDRLIPFLRWAGGKRWFVAYHQHLIPRDFNRYFEPFLGGGSMYFHLAPQDAVIGDANADVIRAFAGVKRNPSRVQILLERHHQLHNEEHYYAVRAAEPRDLAEQAARMIYLNRTCFNGIYRLNQAGRFNVPIGERQQVLMPTDDFAATSRLLQRADVRLGDFEPMIDQAAEGDLVFADPPYTVRHNTNGFVLYNEKLFSWADQVRLADTLERAKARGVKILSTNAAHESVQELYRSRHFRVQTVSRFSPIAAQPASRKQFSELVISG